MLTYITRRSMQAVIILIGLSFFFFFILHKTPGGYCEKYLGEGNGGNTIGQQQRFEACQRRIGADLPIPEQYVKWAGSVATGDFGQSLSTGQPVGQIILQRVPATLLLGGIAYLVQELLALPLGIFAALRRYSFFDSIFTVGTYIGLSMPSFWLSGIMILIFAGALGWLPPGGIVGDTANIPPFNGPGYWSYFIHHPLYAGGDFLHHLILPAAVLAIGGIAYDSRFMRASMLDVINQDYIRTARAKGLTRRVVVFKHALRNALLPIITNVALNLPGLIGGAIIVETIFGWPGMGELYATALGSLDYPTLQALSLILAVGVLFGNLLGDITYAIVDPRIRYD